MGSSTTTKRLPTVARIETGPTTNPVAGRHLGGAWHNWPVLDPDDHGAHSLIHNTTDHGPDMHPGIPHVHGDEPDPHALSQAMLDRVRPGATVELHGGHDITIVAIGNRQPAGPGSFASAVVLYVRRTDYDPYVVHNLYFDDEAEQWKLQTGDYANDLERAVELFNRRSRRSHALAPDYIS
jgi:hypothetical protein